MDANHYQSWNQIHRAITLAGLGGALLGWWIAWINQDTIGWSLVKIFFAGLVCALLTRWVLRQAMRIWLENRLAAAEVEIKAKEEEVKKKLAEEQARKKAEAAVATKTPILPAKSSVPPTVTKTPPKP